MQRLDESELSRPPSEVLEIICKLGKGSYGSVYKARYKATGGIVAVKKVPVDSDLSDIVKEISIMQQCDSPFIVKCYGSLFDSQDLWICMEYCGAGSIADIMRLRNRTLQEEEIATVLHYSLRGLDYLHQMRKIHRDIKAGNILLLNCGTAKLADFGVAGQLSDTLAKRNTVIGTPYWMAPEVIQEIGYNCSADIWSLGITAVEMADGKPPLADIHPMRALFMIPSQPPPTLRKPNAWSVEFRAFVASCLAKTPEARPTAAALLQTEFIRTAKSRTVLLPLIDEANAVREKRLLEAQANSRVEAPTNDPQQPPVGKDNPDAFPSPIQQPSDVPPTGAAEADDSGDTMVRRSTGGESLKCKFGVESAAAATLVSLASSGSATGASNRQIRRPSASAGKDVRHRASAGTDSSDSLGTMVINPSEDEEEEEEDTGSVVVHGTATSAEMDDDLLGRRGANNHNEDDVLAHLEAGGTLTRKRLAKKSEEVGRNPAVDPADPHHIAPPPAGFAQRPFAPFSRALQESGLLPGGPAGLAAEPGCLTRLSYAELEQLLINLSNDLETELRNLAVRYRHKRQPLLDAIAEKTTQTTKVRQANINTNLLNNASCTTSSH